MSGGGKDLVGRAPRLHPAAARGFDVTADAYERGRPEYPDEAVAFMRERLRIAPGRTVLDLAAGTGKLTRALVPSGASLIGVEPVPGMREALRASLPGMSVLDGTAEAIPIDDGSVDAVVVGQAFHWFDGDRAIPEIARVLRPGGGLAIVFNVRDEDDPMQAALSEIWEPHRGETPTHRTVSWREAFANQDVFTTLEHRAFRHEQLVDREHLVDRVVSVSFIAILEPSERDRVAEQVRSMVPDGHVVSLPYRTDVFSADRR
jgi:ubiquinone/menaquinone biosynthesis C-methylase UbiE